MPASLLGSAASTVWLFVPTLEADSKQYVIYRTEHGSGGERPANYSRLSVPVTAWKGGKATVTAAAVCRLGRAPGHFQ